MTMMDDTINIQQTAKSNGLGLRLRAAREALQLSEKEAGARLHLSPKYIAIMENEDFENGLPATFIRGYLRSYARLLNLSEYEINIAIEQLGITSPQQTPIAPILHAQPVNRSDRYVRWITYLVLLILVGLVALWWHSHSRYIVSDMVNHSAPIPPSKTATLSADKSEPSTAESDVKEPVITASASTPTDPTSEQDPTPKPSVPPTASVANAPQETKSPNQLAHMKMEAPEPGLDTSDDGRDDDDGYTN